MTVGYLWDCVSGADSMLGHGTGARSLTGGLPMGGDSFSVDGVVLLLGLVQVTVPCGGVTGSRWFPLVHGGTAAGCLWDW